MRKRLLSLVVALFSASAWSAPALRVGSQGTAPRADRRPTGTATRTVRSHRQSTNI